MWCVFVDVFYVLRLTCIYLSLKVSSLSRPLTHWESNFQIWLKSPTRKTKPTLCSNQLCSSSETKSVKTARKVQWMACSLWNMMWRERAMLENFRFGSTFTFTPNSWHAQAQFHQLLVNEIFFYLNELLTWLNKGISEKHYVCSMLYFIRCHCWCSLFSISQVSDGHFVHFFAPSDLTPLSKNIVFVIDVSGSMWGLKMKQVWMCLPADIRKYIM